MMPAMHAPDVIPPATAVDQAQRYALAPPELPLHADSLRTFTAITDVLTQAPAVSMAVSPNNPITLADILFF